MKEAPSSCKACVQGVDFGKHEFCGECGSRLRHNEEDSGQEHDVREAFSDLLAHMAGAASAYRAHASRHKSVSPRSTPDAMFLTRIKDFDSAVDRGRKFLKRYLSQ